MIIQATSQKEPPEAAILCMPSALYLEQPYQRARPEAADITPTNVHTYAREQTLNGGSSVLLYTSAAFTCSWQPA